jgi:hypothetical protein
MTALPSQPDQAKGLRHSNRGPRARPRNTMTLELSRPGGTQLKMSRIEPLNLTSAVRILNDEGYPVAVPSPLPSDGRGDLSRLGSGERNLAKPKVAWRPSERERASQRQGEVRVLGARTPTVANQPKSTPSCLNSNRFQTDSDQKTASLRAAELIFHRAGWTLSFARMGCGAESVFIRVHPWSKSAVVPSRFGSLCQPMSTASGEGLLPTKNFVSLCLSGLILL